MTDLDELQEELSQTINELDRISKRLFTVKNYMYTLEDERKRLIEKHNSIDRELAMKDGRFKVIKTRKPSTKCKPKEEKMTMEQIVENLNQGQISELAKKFGIKV